MKYYTACFTGHRNIKWELIPAIKTATIAVMENLIAKGCYTFLNGGARGFDLLCASWVLDIKLKYPTIRLNMILPCKEQANAWNEKDTDEYNRILSEADSKIYVHERYTNRCMLDRNDYMVKNSNFCIAYLKNSRGGTFYTVNRAKSSGLEVYNTAEIIHI